MKNILITGGPTTEPIDEIMRVTTFSSGSLALSLTRDFLSTGHSVTLVANDIVNTSDIENDSNLTLIKVATTQEMMDELEKQSKKKQYNALLHTAAVNDYMTDFTFLLEDMAEEIDRAYKEGKVRSAQDILSLMENPECKLDASSKISSYQSNLTVKLGLTPKIIERLRHWYPQTMLIGCKLLENVSKEELFEVATKLCNKNKMDYILANDLAKLRQGNTARFLIDNSGFTGIELDSPDDISKFVQSKI